MLVRARMLADPGYDDWVRGAPDPAERFGDEVLRTHRRTNRLGAGLPWPRALGTIPWAVARELPGPHRVRWVLDRERAWDWLVTSPDPVPLYVGNAALPRHVVLVVEAAADRALVYEPGAGVDRAVDRAAFLAGRLGLAGWQRPWCMVTPCST